MRQKNETPGAEPGAHNRTLDALQHSTTTPARPAARRLDVLGLALLDVVLWVVAGVLWSVVFQ